MSIILVSKAGVQLGYRFAHCSSDGGFFVFPDLSVKIEGDFRLRFSLFEMLKFVSLSQGPILPPNEFRRSRVAYIKSAISDPFTGEIYPRTVQGSRTNHYSFFTAIVPWHV